MNNRFRGILLLLIGVVLIGVGLVAVFLLSRQAGLLGLVAPQAQVQPTPVSVVKSKVVIVKNDKKIGDLLHEEDVALIDVPTELVPRDSISSVAEVLGKFSKTDLVQGEMLLKHNLADPTNVSHDLAFALSDDHVMMAISISDVMTKESIVQRGDIVDVLVTMSEEVAANSSPSSGGSQGGTSGQSGGTGTTSGTGTASDQKTGRQFTFDAFQKMNITALVMDVITTNQQQTVQQAAGGPTPVPSRQQTNVRAYFLALKPQDALVLKHMKNNGATFDLVLRAPTSTQSFDLTPVTAEYIIELYRLEILK